jgi:RNA polymerase sigma-70 factor (ECF subfamily)
MGETELLAQQFEANRAHLRAVAYRMLGSQSEAEDAVQEAWLRLSRTDANAVTNLTGWLTTVVARVCLDLLRTRKIRREEPIGIEAETLASHDDAERDAALAESIGAAMLAVLQTLSPPERVAFVLHDMFSLPFEDIAPTIGRSPVAARQLASRARRRVQGKPALSEADRTRQREIVQAFLAASRGGDFAALLAVLDPAVVVRADAAAVAASAARASEGAPALEPEIHGRERVAKLFRGQARAAQPAMVDGNPGLVFAPGGKPFAVFEFVIANDAIMEIVLTVDTQTIGTLTLEY